MGLEIEYKFLVKNDNYKKMSTKSYRIRQGYLSRVPERVVRVRIKGNAGYLTVKGKNHGATRLEFEYEIPLEDAERMLELCDGPVIDKIRYIVAYEGHKWDVDEFLGGRTGLVIAEIELGSENEPFAIPDFIGEDVTGNPQYYNSNLN